MEFYGKKIRNSKAKKDVSKKNVKPKEHSKHKTRIQNDEAQTKNEKQNEKSRKIQKQLKPRKIFI